MSNFEDNPSVSHKPIDVVKTQLHIIQSEVQELKNDIHKLHTINKSILKVLEQMERRRIDKERDDKVEKKKIQSGWGFF
jgi:conjugal transfer/entry exclusion protein